ncbi:MAG TPA: hypothetical protein VGO50_08445 [Pyrinomonadaceae bacterium]|jgi:hypothetical protein|nr:hypothetical protein [Pyrinomonadaceae bacterium]
MRKISLLTALIILSCINLTAQTPAATPKALPDIGITATLALGEVTAINAEQKNLTLKTKDGDINITLSDATEYQKASPANPTDLKLATPGVLADIGVGDRLIASGKVADDKKSMISRRIILMTKADLSKRQQAESEAWNSGVKGKVATVNPLTRELTVTMRSLMGERTVIVNAPGETRFLRYAPHSVKFSDAVAGNFSEVKTGDLIRARGSRSDDGTHFTANEIISGSFRTAGGVITAIDTVKNEITINDVVTKKPLTIALSETSVLRKFPADMAQRYVMAQTGQMGPGGAGGAGGMRPAGQPGAAPTTPPAGGQTPPQGSTAGNAPGAAPGQTGQHTGPGGAGGVRPGGGGRDLDEMLERLPIITIADLKVGEAIAVSSIPAQDPNRVSAIKLLAGVEPFLNAPSMQMPQGPGRTASPSINIPGLDGIGSP